MKKQKVFVLGVELDFLNVKNIVGIVDKKGISKFIMKNNYKNFIDSEVFVFY